MARSARGQRMGRGWAALGLVVLVMAGVAAWIVGRSWILRQAVNEAARHGVALSACELELGLRSVALNACEFGLMPDAAQRGWPLPGVAASGGIERLLVVLEGWRPARLQVRGLRAVLRGEPPGLDGLGGGRGPASASLPIDVEDSSASWYFGPGSTPALVFDELAYAAEARRLSSKLDLPNRARGELTLGPDGAHVTLGDAARPALRLQLRFAAEAQRVELGVELSKLPLRWLEGERLRLTPTLRELEVDGRISFSVPVGLTMTLPSGNVTLVLHGLSFPVPREVQGLVHGTPPRLSGKLSANRTLDRVTFPDLTFLTGSLEMHGTAQLDLEEGGVKFQTQLRGPLSCRAIAESARRAHEDSVLAQLAGRWGAPLLTGSVQVVAAIEGHTLALDQARVLTSIGVGCGLRPLPLDPDLPRELLERLPPDILERLPELPREGGVGSMPGVPERFRLPPLPRLSPPLDRR